MASGYQREYMALDRPRHQRPLGQRPGPERRRQDPASFPHEVDEVNFDLRTGSDPNYTDCPLNRQRSNVGRPIGCTHKLKNQVEWTGLDKLGWGDSRGPESVDLWPERLVSHSRCNSRSGGDGQLHGSGPHAASSPVDTNPISHGEPALVEKGIECSLEDFRESAGLRTVKWRGDRHRQRFIKGTKFGLGATGHHRHHPFANAKPMTV